MARVFWASAAGFITGIVCVAAIDFTLSSALFAIVIASAFFLLHPRDVALPLFFICVFLGMWRADIPLVRDANLDAALGTEVRIEGVVIAEPDERERGTRLTIELESGARVLVVAPAHVELSYGDRIIAEGELSLPRSFETGEGRSFDYASYLALSGVTYVLSFAETERISSGEPSPTGWAIALKEWYVRGLEHALTEPHAGLAAGITAGEKRGLGDGLSETFRIAGLTHIVVLSGYNIMIVIAFCERLLAKLGRTARLVASVAIAIFFVLMTGFAAASVRAASMAMIGLFARATGRTYVALRALAFVALVMIIVNPRVLLSDPGFQLSVIATWGLIVLSPIIEARLSRIPERMGMRTIIATTIGTQIAVLPLILYQSGLLSLVSLPANVLILPVVPVAMLASFLGGLAGALVPAIAPLVAAPAFALLAYIISIAQLLAAMPHSSVIIPPFSVIALIGAYALLAIGVHARNEQR